MGINGLWKVVEPTSVEIPLECLEGKKLAVDISIWIYQAQLSYPSDQQNPHLRLLINRLCKLLFYKIRPVFVFDGPSVPALKRQVLEMRRVKKLKDDDILTNSKKMHHLKQIATGQLNESELAKSVQTVISPSKRVVLNDVYKDIPSTSTVNLSTPSEPILDQVYIESESDDDQKDQDITIVSKDSFEAQPSYDDLKPKTRRETIEKLVERREIMRTSRLHPAMIPSDSKDFSNFQMQRLLRRGRLNSEIEKLTKSTTSTGDKINVVGPDGTQHILKHSYSDEIQLVPITETSTRDIEALYRAEDKMDLSLDIFRVEYGGGRKREKTPIDVDVKEEEIIVDGGYQSKSGLLDEIARKRIRLHYDIDSKRTPRKSNKIDDDDDDDLIEVSNFEHQFPSTKIDETDNNDDDKNTNWDPQRFDKSIKANMTNDKDDDNDDEWIRLNYEEDDRTPEMYRDIQEFLTNCGIPWLEAPGEAEAQCVELERLGLVDGVISDDSDVWAFGVQNVYRHMFAKNKRVQRYGRNSSVNKNCQLFCLQREDFISIALLSGGDYCAGLNKVGAIGALELIAEFVECRQDVNRNDEIVKQRIMRLLDKIRQILTSSADELPNISASRSILTIRRHVVEANDKRDIDFICSNSDAVDAYLHPNVDTSTEKFRWRRINIDLIRNIMHQRLNWPEQCRIEAINSCEALERWNSFLTAGGTSQMRLDRFFAQPNDGTLMFSSTWSKKVIEALSRISKRSKGIVDEPVEKKPEKKTKTIANRRGTGGSGRRGRGGRGRGAQQQKVEELNLSEESSDDN